MKTLKLCIFSLLAIALCMGAGMVNNMSQWEERRAKAAKCWGKIRIVNIDPDFKVGFANAGAELRVAIVPIADEIGEWELVTVGEDYTVEFVTVGEDFSIEYSNFPGLN